MNTRRKGLKQEGARIYRGRKLYRSRERRFVESAPFPRWITAPVVLIIGLMLWLEVLSDPSGKLRMPGVGSILFLGAVVGAAAFLAYARRDTGSATGIRPWRNHRKRGASTSS